jgi:cyclopropane fatty-acyl-phospholipid synthase-like methyltransferase
LPETSQYSSANMSKPFTQSCENNKQYILDLIRDQFPTGSLVLEIGSYTAQHVLHFAEAMPDVYWQPSDLPENLATLVAGLAGNRLTNIAPPLALDVSQLPWPIAGADGVFTANTLHIMPYADVEKFFDGVKSTLRTGGKLCVYGPFKYHGEFTTPSNGRFDLWLKERNPLSGVRDFEQADAWAQAAGLHLLTDHAMPANNQLLVWQKQ